MSEETVFEAASLGKPVFAYAVLRLVDAGVIDLDRPLFDYLPIPDANNPRMKRVTARHVLSHTTGLPNWRQQPVRARARHRTGQASFSYSGEGYFYLQRVVEALTRAALRPLHAGAGARSARHEAEQLRLAAGVRARMAAGYDGQEKRLDVQAAIGRRTLAIARNGASRSPIGDTRTLPERFSWSTPSGRCFRSIWCPMPRRRS